MKAIVYKKYGPPEVLVLTDIKKPVPKPNEVLVKVHAASINSWDWDMVRGKPWIVRLWGLFSPRINVLGADIAGIVESVGDDVTKFKPGDEVFGDLAESGWGGYAEYTCAHENGVVLKPRSMTFEEAAAIPQAGMLALQSIDKAQLKPMQKVLLNGAGGGVGTIGLQLAKSMGAHVTVVDSEDKLQKLKVLGADNIIDYRKEDFTNNLEAYDLIVDVVASRPLSHYKRALKPGGMFIMIGGTMPAILKTMLAAKWISKNSNKKLTLLAYVPNQGLEGMIKLFESGQLKPIIDKVFPLSKTAAAFQYFADGKFVGKVIIKIV